MEHTDSSGKLVDAIGHSDHSVLYQRHRHPLRRLTSRARAAEGQQTLEIEPTQLCTNQAPEARRADE